MITLNEPDLAVLAAAWADVDPDDETRVEIQALLSADGDALTQQFGSRLEFGTAGLRGTLGTGPSCMNQVLVRGVAAALAVRVKQADSDPVVVVGYDARHKSSDFATDTARVLAAHGVRCTLLPSALPTPVLAFAVKHLGASAGVMVTASHNPRADNGYKVYWRGGAQITAPIDAEIAALIDTTPLQAEADLAPLDDPAITIADDTLMHSYLEAVTGLLSSTGPRTTQVAYTPIHGVGAGTFCAAFTEAGFPAPAVVASQAMPDPDFPGIPFPNPEEPGVLDAVLALASDTHADVVLANDPDADRLAVCVPDGRSWRLLSGDEVGCLLANYLLADDLAAHQLRSGDTEDGRRRLVINTVVSSRLLAKIAKDHDADYAESLTGFKWIMATRDAHPDADFVLGYEEALGYSIGDEVRDKDGISAGLMVAEMIATLAGEACTLLDELDALHRRHGVHVSGQRPIRFEPASNNSVSKNPASRQSEAMAVLRAHPPTVIAGRHVESTTDLLEPGADLPLSDTLIFELRAGRIVIRPSGTEAKLKVYGEVAMPLSDDLAQSRAEAHAILNELLDDVVTMAASPEQRSFRPRDQPSETEPLTARADELMRYVDPAVFRDQDLRLIVRCVDLTTLEGDDTAGRVRALCATARRPAPADPSVGPTAAVCVYPSLVPIAKAVTAGTSVRVASVAGAFPSALSPLFVRLADIHAAIDGGADEVDIVLNRSAFLDGHLDVVAAELRAARDATPDTVLKVILEVGDLDAPDAIREATSLAIAAGADFVKTSTGKSGFGASPMAVLVMAEEIASHATQTGSKVGLKISGGVRTAADALGYVAIVRSVLGEAWLSPELLRFGASSLVGDVVAELASDRRDW